MDNYIVSARKYRPGNFHSVIGQKSLTTTLKNAILHNKLAHAYLFCGPRGVGKTTCARIFAKSINCLSPKADGEPCNECESCQSFNENRSYNIHELDAASNNSVDDIRSLTEQVRIPPQLGKYKVYIIDEVHMLSTAAFNAFLKTLEEPPHYAIFILATTEKHKILPTILSRCQIYDFNRININDIVDYLEYVAGEEKVTFEREALNVIAQKADGGMRDALSIFDQVVSFSQGNMTYKSVIDNLNVLDYEYYFSLTEAFLGGDVSRSLLLFNEILEKGFDGQHFLTGLAGFFRDLLVCKDPQTIVLFETGDAVKEKYLSLGQACPQSFLYKAIEMSNETDLNYRLSKNKRLLIELLLIRLCQLMTPEAEDKKKNLIKPLEVKADTPKQDETPVASTVSLPKPTEGRKATTLKSNEIPRFSLKNPKEKTEEKAVATSEQVQEEQHESFTQKDLLTHWRTYARKIEDAHLKNTILNFEPRLLENNQIEVEVSNPTQESKLNEIVNDIYYHLSSHLKNTHIKISIKQSETVKDNRPFFPQEKYQFMVNKNPDLAKLVEEFGLKLS